MSLRCRTDRGFIIGARVLNKFVRVEHIVADLTPEVRRDEVPANVFDFLFAFRVWGLGFRVSFGVLGLGFMV